MPEKQTKDFDFTKYIFIALFVVLLSAIVGCCCYDAFNNAKTLRIVNFVVMGLTTLITVLSFFGVGIPVKTKKAKALLASICAGIGFGILISVLVCDLGGMRLKLIRIGTEGPTSSQSTSSAGSSDSSETDRPENDGTAAGQNEDQSHLEDPGQSDSAGSVSTPTAEDDLQQENDKDVQIEGSDYNNPISVAGTSDEDMSHHVVSDFFQAADVDFPYDPIALSAENKTVWSASFEDKIRMLVDTESLSNSYDMNWDADFSSKTSEANKMEEDIKENGKSIEKLLDLIALRKEAYEIYPTANLRRLLANNYSQLAKQYKSAEQWEESYESYIESIKYEALYIRSLSGCDDKYYIHLHNLATRCHAIGDISVLSADSKIEAMYLSACLFEATSKNAFSENHEHYQSDSYYYAGVVNHKLVNLCWQTYDRDTYHYFEDACAYYSKALDYPNNKKIIYSSLANLYSWAQKYIQRYGRADDMLTRSEYKELENKYTDLGR